jgi:general secretion pathway protein L
VSERLIIRVGSQADSDINWLVWSDDQQEIIASGTLSDASELVTLSQRASGHKVCVLVPAADVGLFDVELPESNRRQALKAIPFMLEDELASEIELVHFVHGSNQGNKQGVYVVAKAKMKQWLQWFEDANITIERLVPDWLALPLPSDENSVSVIQLNQQLLIRQGQQQGYTIATSWIEAWLELAKQQTPNLVLENYGISESVAQLDANWQTRDPMLPMQCLALGVTKTKVNLLIGEFAQVKQQSQVQLWWRVAAVAGIALVLVFVEKFYQLNQLTNQKDAVVASSQAIYRQLNPQAKRVDRLKYRVKQQLKKLTAGGQESPYLLMISSLNNAFIKVPQLKPVSIKYDNKRQELRVQADANSYQEFERFKREFGPQYSVTTGAMNNNGNKVNGSLTIKVAS